MFVMLLMQQKKAGPNRKVQNKNQHLYRKVFTAFELRIDQNQNFLFRTKMKVPEYLNIFGNTV